MRPMRRIFQTVSWIALAATAMPSILFLYGSIDLDGAKLVMLLGTIVWFVATPLWMGRRIEQAAEA